jgi:hypothetical protein
VACAQIKSRAPNPPVCQSSCPVYNPEASNHTGVPDRVTSTTTICSQLSSGAIARQTTSGSLVPRSENDGPCGTSISQFLRHAICQSGVMSRLVLSRQRRTAKAIRKSPARAEIDQARMIWIMLGREHLKLPPLRTVQSNIDVMCYVNVSPVQHASFRPGCPSPWAFSPLFQ